MYEWEGTAGRPATKVARIDYDYLHEFDVRQANSAVAYINQHAKDAKPFFMDVNFMKMHNPNIPAKAFIGKSHLGNYSDAMLELDSNIGKVMDAIRAEAPNTIVIITADNGAWQDAWPDAGTVPFRGEKGSPFEGGFRVPGIMWWPNHIPAGARYGEMMSHIDLWATLATMVGLTRRPTVHGRTITVSQSISTALTTAPTSRARLVTRRAPRGSIPTERASRAHVPTSAMIPRTPTLHIAWKVLYTAKDTWLGPQQNLGAIGSNYNLTMDPFEKYDMTFNGAVSTRTADYFAGPLRRLRQWLGYFPTCGAILEFDKSIVDFPNIKRFPGGASNDMNPNLQNPANPLPLMDIKKVVRTIGMGD